MFELYPPAKYCRIKIYNHYGVSDPANSRRTPRDKDKAIESIAEALGYKSKTLEYYMQGEGFHTEPFKQKISEFFGEPFEQIWADEKTQAKNIVKSLWLSKETKPQPDLILHMEKLKNNCVKLGLKTETGMLLNLIAKQLFMQGNIIAATEKLNSAIDTLRAVSAFVQMTRCYSDLGFCYYYDANMEKAKECLHQAQLMEKENIIDIDTKFMIFYRLGLIYREIGNKTNIKRSIEYLKKADTFSNGDKMLMGACSLSVAMCYVKIKDYSKAFRFYKISEEFYLENPIKVSIVYNNRAFLYVKMNNFKKANEEILKALNLTKNIQCEYTIIYKLSKLEIDSYNDNFNVCELELCLDNLNNAFVLKYDLNIALKGVIESLKKENDLLREINKLLLNLAFKHIENKGLYKVFSDCYMLSSYYLNGFKNKEVNDI